MTSAVAPSTNPAIELAIRAHGTPVPQGSHHAQIIGKGRAIVVASNANGLRKWRKILCDAAEQAMTAAGWLTLTGPVAVDVVFLLERPRSVRRLLPTVAPDLDKLVRTLDSLTDAGVWADDSRVVDLRAAKRYTAGGQAPGVRVRVRPVDEVIL